VGEILTISLAFNESACLAIQFLNDRAALVITERLVEDLTAVIKRDSSTSQPLAALAAIGIPRTVDATATAKIKSLDVFFMMPPLEPKQHRCLQLVSGSIHAPGLKGVGLCRFPALLEGKDCDCAPAYAKLVETSGGIAGQEPRGNKCLLDQKSNQSLAMSVKQSGLAHQNRKSFYSH
jgi:hypothetical protein